MYRNSWFISLECLNAPPNGFSSEIKNLYRYYFPIGIFFSLSLSFALSCKKWKYQFSFRSNLLNYSIKKIISIRFLCVSLSLSLFFAVSKCLSRIPTNKIEGKKQHESFSIDFLFCYPESKRFVAVGRYIVVLMVVVVVVVSFLENVRINKTPLCDCGFCLQQSNNKSQPTMSNLTRLFRIIHKHQSAWQQIAQLVSKTFDRIEKKIFFFSFIAEQWVYYKRTLKPIPIGTTNETTPPEKKMK